MEDKTMLLAPMSNAGIDPENAATWTARDRAILSRVDHALRVGLALKGWWEKTDVTNGYSERFELVRAFNRPDTSFGFFDRVSLEGATMPVMGVVEDLLYDQPQQATVETVRDQLREFILHYFLRVSAFRQPDAYVESARPAPATYLPGLSWCPEYEIRQGGFGFSQHYYKRRDSQVVGKFLAHEEDAILDLRAIAAQYEWIVLKVQIFDFNLTFRPLGSKAVQLVFPLQESSYLVMSPDFLINQEKPRQGVLAEYGFGYAFIKEPDEQGPFAYGPGHFDASFQLIAFRVLDTGEIRVGLVFVANRPQRIVNIPVDPVDWGYRLVDQMSFGLTSRLFAPMKQVFDKLPLRINGFDPLTAYIVAASFLTGGIAARELCISTEQLEKAFLLQHFRQHYQMMTGSLLTWRQIPDFLDSSHLPEWVVKGATQ